MDRSVGSGFGFSHYLQAIWGVPWLSPRFLIVMRDDGPSGAASGPGLLHTVSVSSPLAEAGSGCSVRVHTEELLVFMLTPTPSGAPRAGEWRPSKGYCTRALSTVSAQRKSFYLFRIILMMQKNTLGEAARNLTSHLVGWLRCWSPGSGRDLVTYSTI